MRWTAWLLLLAVLTGCSGGPVEPPPSPATPDAVATSGPTSGGPDLPPLPPAPARGGSGGVSRPDDPQVDYNPPPVGSPPSSPGQRPESDQTPPPSEESPEQWRQNHKVQPRGLKAYPDLLGYDQVVAKFPPGPSMASVVRGEKLYTTYCKQCHGVEGLPDEKSELLARYRMADLRQPLTYKFGADERALYRSIAFGVPSAPMGYFKELLTDQDIWDLVYYVQSKTGG